MDLWKLVTDLDLKTDYDIEFRAFPSHNRLLVWTIPPTSDRDPVGFFSKTIYLALDRPGYWRVLLRDYDNVYALSVGPDPLLAFEYSIRHLLAIHGLSFRGDINVYISPGVYYFLAAYWDFLKPPKDSGPLLPHDFDV